MTSNGSITRCRCPRLRRLGALREPRHFLADTAKLLDAGAAVPLEPVNRTEKRPAVADLPARSAPGSRRSTPSTSPSMPRSSPSAAVARAHRRAVLKAPDRRRPGPCACALTDGREPRFQPHRVPGGGPTTLRRGDVIHIRADFTLRRSYAALLAAVRIVDDTGRCVFGLDDSERSFSNRPKRLDRLEDLARRRPARGRLFDLAQARRRGRRQGRFHSRGCTTRWPSRSRRPRAFGTGPAAISFR